MAVNQWQFGQIAENGDFVVRQFFVYRLQDNANNLVHVDRFSLLIGPPEQSSEAVKYCAGTVSFTNHSIQGLSYLLMVGWRSFQELQCCAATRHNRRQRLPYFVANRRYNRSSAQELVASFALQQNIRAGEPRI